MNEEPIESEEEVFDYDVQTQIDSDFDIDTYDFSSNLTKPKLNKYERATVKIMRCEQIDSGFQPLLKDYHRFSSIEDIVDEELKQKVIPFIIKRNLRNRIDYWKLSDMET